MDEILINNKKYLPDNDIFNVNVMAEYLIKNNEAIFILLDYKKANTWPVRGKCTDKNDYKRIPLLWALFFSANGKDVKMLYEPHPTKCLPNIYNSNNTNKKKDITIRKNNGGHTIGGCGRDYAVVGNNKYEVSELIPKYCSSFGLPDNCFDNDYEKRLINVLKIKNELNIWCF